MYFLRASLISSIICMLALGGCQNAQTTESKILKSDAKAAAEMACGCVNNILKDLDPVLVEMLAIMASEGEKEGEKFLVDYMAKQSKLEQQQLLQEFNKVRKFKDSFKKDCLSKLNERYSAYKDDLTFEKELIRTLAETKDCEMVHNFYLMGTARKPETGTLPETN